MSYPAFDPGPTTVCAVSPSAATFQISGAPQSGQYQVRVYNSLPSIVFMRMISSAMPEPATVNDVPLAPNVPESFTFDNTTSVSLISSSGAGNVFVTVGFGV